MSPPDGSIIEKNVIIVGGGFGGCYLLHLLRKNGYSTRLLEAGRRLGGVWGSSCYPGARVDCELPYYGFSDPDIWGTWKWTQRFPDFRELRSYFEHVDRVWNLAPDVELNTRVTESQWQEESNAWIVTTAGGQQYKCKWFLAATGTSFKQHFPDIPGLDAFKGALHHSAAWPEEGVDMTGKRVAIIGAGSSGIQVVQEAAKVAKEVTQFIRSPNFCVPMRQRDISEEEIYHTKPHIQHMFRVCRSSRSGLPIVGTGRKVFDDDEPKRMEVWEEQWKRGGFNWSQGSYTDTLFNREANATAYAFWREKTRQRIKDPKKAELLAPMEQPYYVGTKRPSMEQDYFEMCDLPHVEITNSPITGINATGVQAEDGKLREYDIVAVCTGYDAVTGGLRTMGIQGRGGLGLDEKWKDGVITNLGMIVNGFPNMFIVYGPQAPTSLTNGPPFIELQCEWILEVLNKQRDENRPTVEADKAAEEAWRNHTLDIANKTLAVETNSWYMGANVPGKRREFLIYLGGMTLWHDSCQKALEDWKGFA